MRPRHAVSPPGPRSGPRIYPERRPRARGGLRLAPRSCSSTSRDAAGGRAVRRGPAALGGPRIAIEDGRPRGLRAIANLALVEGCSGGATALRHARDAIRLARAYCRIARRSVADAGPAERTPAAAILACAVRRAAPVRTVPGSDRRRMVPDRAGAHRAVGRWTGPLGCGQRAREPETR
jgi:hypothetical protein